MSGTAALPAWATATALLAPIAEAEPVVSEYRRRLDPSASWGVPAHVTILFPFVPTPLVDAPLLDAVGQLVDGVGPIDCSFAELRWFRDEVLWLAPDPAEPFIALTEAVCRRFPGHLPYDGGFAEIVPHLTIGQGDDVDALRRAAADVGEALPISARVDRLVLLAGVIGRGPWVNAAEWPLRQR